MANEVFANDLEIACKRADGKSIACFPDPCWTPGNVVPFANTAYAKDTDNASKTVFISGKPIMKKDVSYFKTSTGNELAKGRKGFFTGVKKGKSYFTSWSMNVKVEGHNVDRHTDGMTHNHGSTSGNTGKNYYLDTGIDSNCKSELKAKESKCEVSETENEKFKDKRKSRNKGRGKRSTQKPDLKIRNKTWKDNHCKDLLFAVDQPENLKKSLDKLEDKLDDFSDDLLNAAGEKLGDVVVEKIVSKMSIGVCGAIGGAVGGIVGLLGILGGPTVAATVTGGAVAGAGIGASICGIALLAKDVTDAIRGSIDLYQNKDEILSQLDDLDKYGEKYEKVKDYLDEPTPEKLKELEDDMAKAIENSPCLKAKRCILVPKSVKDPIRAIKAGKGSLTDKYGFGNPHGCCPGQTGHHLVTDAAVAKGENCKDSVANGPKIGKNIQKKYNYDAAPTTCVTGSSHSGGEHGELHDQTDINVQKMLDGNYEEEKGFDSCTTNFTLDCSIEAASQAHSDKFPHCDKACTTEQLKKYYEKMGCTTDPVNKIGKPMTSTPTPNKNTSTGG